MDTRGDKFDLAANITVDGVPEDYTGYLNRSGRLDQFAAPDGEWRITYCKLLVWAGFPIFCGACSISVWYVILRWQRQLEDLYTRFISTLVILLFLVHPQITQYMVDMFGCQRFDGQNRLLIDPQIVCWDHMHLRLTGSVGVFGLAVWGLGIPAMIYALMAKEKERLDTDAAKIRYGFLYNGYKRDAYFWEIVVMYRKIVCLFIAVFLKPIGIVG
jgi:hypothetical protein